MLKSDMLQRGSSEYYRRGDINTPMPTISLSTVYLVAVLRGTRRLCSRTVPCILVLHKLLPLAEKLAQLDQWLRAGAAFSSHADHGEGPIVRHHSVMSLSLLSTKPITIDIHTMIMAYDRKR